jgi:glycerol-3-phosphate acyltransferase PlsY
MPDPTTLDPNTWPFALSALVALAFGYLLGSIPFGVLLTRLAGMQDIRSVGSGNIGATNVLRTGRKTLAAATLVGDMLKGTAAVLIVLWLASRELALIAAFGAFVGHLFPVWLGFRGGKGVATYIGLLLALSWPVALGFCAVWLAVAAVTRYSSLSALVASAATPVALWLTGLPLDALLLLLLTLVLWYRHRENISRLVRGTETRIGLSRSA